MSCACGADPCACGPFTVLDADNVRSTLARELIPVIDCARDLFTSLGVRSYQVMLVKTQWSGGERGRGQESVVWEQMLLPTPKVAELTSIRRDLEALGTIEAGTLRVSEISARYSEDLLTGLGEDGSKLPKDMQFYWEVNFISPGTPSIRRRFIPKAAPSLNLAKIQWVVDLVKVSDDRLRISGAANG